MDTFCYRKGSIERLTEHVLANTLHRITHDREKLWIDIPDPTAHELEFLKTYFSIHPRTLESIRHGASRPIVEEFDSYLYVVLYGLDEHGHFVQLSFLLGENYLITIHKRHIHSFELLKRDIPLIASLLSRDTEFIMHALVLEEVSKHGPILERFDEEISSLEERIMTDHRDDIVKRIFTIKHQVITLRHHLSPMDSVLEQLSRKGVKFVMPSCADHFRDVYHQLLGILETIDNYREILNGLLQVHFNIASNRLNDIIKILTVISVIFMPLTLIASIYGMNFSNMPELQWTNGYFLTLASMMAITVLLLAFFRNRKWI